MKSKLLLATFNSGSTYLQRALTFWVHELITNSIRNPHELLNGIGWYKGHLVKSWTDVNAQSVDELIAMLRSNKSPLVLRLAYDHALLRKDQSNLQSLYDFLNNKFDTYYSRRDNLFDLGLCYAIRRQTQRDPDKQINNVYDVQERQTLYGHDINFRVMAEDVVAQSAKYLDYIAWVAKYFRHAIPISYEATEQNIDVVLQTLTGTAESIVDRYGISIAQYTLIQYARSQASENMLDCSLYQRADAMQARLLDLCQQKIMLDPIPIKSTTMNDKISKVTNFDECVSVFNDWARNQDIEEIDQAWIDNQRARCRAIYQGL